MNHLDVRRQKVFDAVFENRVRVPAADFHPFQGLVGQAGDFFRLREVSAPYRVPRAFLTRFARAQTASVTVTMRNVGIWTDFTGLDPETDQFLTVPADKRWTVKFNFTF